MNLTDITARVLLASWFLFAALGQWSKFRAEHGILAAPQLFAMMFLLLSVGLLIIRQPSWRKADGAGPRLTAFLGCFLFTLVIYLPASPPTVVQTVLAGILITVGYILSLTALINLGRSFSVMAEARTLKTQGMYRYVRHPLYASEQVMILGVMIQFFSVYALALFLLQFYFQLRRMGNEERVLSEAFPEYQAYSTRTRRMIPGIY